MKKKLMILLVLLVFCLDIGYSATATGYPLTGAFGVNLVSKEYIRRQQSVKWVDESTSQYDGEDPRMYSRIQTVALGGIASPSSSTMNVTIDCPNGFYFVNNANPAYKRPFILQLVAIKDRSSGAYNPCSTLEEGINSVTLDYGRTGDIHFDLILVLEGDVSDSGELSIGGQYYPLAEGEYSALVNIVISAPDVPEYVITIPFSGYYSRGSIPSGVDTQASLYVSPTAYASNLSIDSMAGMWKPLAEVYFNYNFGLEDNKNYENDIKLFFSSSRFPNDDNGKFKLVHVSELNSLNPSNSGQIGYSIRFEDEFGNRVDFTGDMTVGKLASASTRQYITVKKGEQPKEGQLFSTPNYYYTSGTAYIRIDPVGTKILKSGMYESNVYLHVVAEV